MGGLVGGGTWSFLSSRAWMERACVSDGLMGVDVDSYGSQETGFETCVSRLQT